jgi:hypothetical protein
MSGEDNTDDIGAAVIDPNAEPRTGALPSTSAKSEERFFANAKNEHEHELRMAKHKSGWLGGMFGSASEAPTNIAGFLIICCVVIIGLCLFLAPSEAVTEVRKWALSLVTLIVGYLLGSKSSKD